MDPAAISFQRNSVLCHQRLVQGTLAAAFGDSALYYECVADNRKAAEEGTAEAYTYRMYPLLSDEGNEPWFLFSPSALLGVNNAISEEKQDACRRILELLSTPEGQEALMEDMGDRNVLSHRLSAEGRFDTLRCGGICGIRIYL